MGISGDSRVRVTRWNVGKGRNEECGIEASQLRKDLGRGGGCHSPEGVSVTSEGGGGGDSRDRWREP